MRTVGCFARHLQNRNRKYDFDHSGAVLVANYFASVAIVTSNCVECHSC